MLDRSKPAATAAKGSSAANLYGTLWRWHFLAAAIVIPFVLWQSVTGTLYLWSERWMDASHPELRFVEPSGPRAPPSALIAAAAQTMPEAREGGAAPTLHTHGTVPVADGTSAASAARPVQEILLSDDPRRSSVVLFEGANGLPYAVFLDPYDARVLGVLSGRYWLPGVTRALHGGWPLGAPGSWLLELGDGWAIFMIASGLYLWWPRGRSLRDALLPRFHLGTRIALRDLHACVAVVFAAVFLFFLISALPWTAFWGQQLLPRIQAVFDQTTPFDFSPGGVDADDLGRKAAALDRLVADARRRDVRGTLDIRLAAWPNAPFSVTNRGNPPADDRTLVADSQTGGVVGDYSNDKLPALPRLVALGVHVHQGDFGPINVWINTAFALSLIWLTVTGVCSWWIRRPKGRLGVPPKRAALWPWPVQVTALAICLAMPIFGASVAAVAGLEKIMRSIRS